MQGVVGILDYLYLDFWKLTCTTFMFWYYGLCLVVWNRAFGFGSSGEKKIRALEWSNQSENICTYCK